MSSFGDSLEDNLGEDIVCMLSISNGGSHIKPADGVIFKRLIVCSPNNSVSTLLPSQQHDDFCHDVSPNESDRAA
jgi:hypothetical protein